MIASESQRTGTGTGTIVEIETVRTVTGTMVAAGTAEPIVGRTNGRLRDANETKLGVMVVMTGTKDVVADIVTTGILTARETGITTGLESGRGMKIECAAGGTSSSISRMITRATKISSLLVRAVDSGFVEWAVVPERVEEEQVRMRTMTRYQRRRHGVGVRATGIMSLVAAVTGTATGIETGSGTAKMNAIMTVNGIANDDLVDGGMITTTNQSRK